MFLGSHLPPAPPLTGEGNEAFMRILDSITDGFMVVDAQWRITYFNEAARKMYAPHMEDPSALLGKDHWDVFPATRGTFLEQEYRRAVSQGAAVELENFYIPWSIWFSVRLFPIRGGGLSIYFRDITEAKRADAALRASEEKYRFLFSSIDEGFAVIKMLWNADGSPADYRFVEVNGMFEKLTGLRSVTGRTAKEMVPGLEAHWFEIYGRVASTGEGMRFVEKSEALGRWFDMYAFPLHREPDLVALLFTDVTARRQDEQEVARLSAAERARVAELEALLDVMPVGIGIATDPECREIRVNAGFAQMLGLRPEDNASKTAVDGERPENFRILDDSGQEIADTELPMQVAAREGRAVLEREVSVAFADGRTVRLLEYAAPLFDEKGAPRGSVGAFVDITERRETAERQAFLLSLEEAVRPLSDPDDIVAASARLLGQHLRVSRCAYANIEADEDTMNITGDYCHGVASIMGRYTFAQFGTEVLQLMRADQPYVVDDTEDQALEPGILASYRATSIRSVICVPLHKGGRFVAAMAVHQNSPRCWSAAEVKLVLQVANRCWEALERARVTHSLAQAKEAAEAANRAKDSFLAALSHELRTPLTPVLMAAEDLCDDPALPQSMHSTMCMMRRNITLEARLIDDLLDLTRISRGKFSLRLQHGDAHALMGLALEIVREDAQSRQQAIVLDLAASHTRLHCDPARLQQVFWNLFKNAVKFTPAGGRIHIRSFDAPDRIIVDVADTGIGIASDALERIFLPFEQVATAAEHRFGGLGLGLSISKAIVEMHGGAIRASSRGLDQGAAFRVELPASMPPQGVNEVPAATPPAHAPVEHTALRLLVVEDHEHTLDVLSRLLRRSGHTVLTASTVATARELATTHPFDMVISDIGLPDGSGNELMKSLHAQHGLCGIALTGYGMEEDERRARESGFVAHLTKPVDFAQLRRTLAEVAGKARGI